MIRLLIASLALGMCCGAHAAPLPASANADQLRPYLQVKPVPGDETMVRTFFSPACSFSRQYYPLFVNLAVSLPNEKRFAFTPVVNKGDGLPYAFAFAAVQRFYADYVNNFVDASLRGVQDMGISTRNWYGLERIGRAAGIPVPLARLVEDNLPVLKKDVQHMIELQAKLKITNTPSVAVVGTYVVTPEFTNGDSSQFSALVNAVISMTTLHN
jgi:protein-disulfide isomerase